MFKFGFESSKSSPNGSRRASALTPSPAMSPEIIVDVGRRDVIKPTRKSRNRLKLKAKLVGKRRPLNSKSRRWFGPDDVSDDYDTFIVAAGVTTNARGDSSDDARKMSIDDFSFENAGRDHSVNEDAFEGEPVRQFAYAPRADASGDNDDKKLEAAADRSDADPLFSDASRGESTGVRAVSDGNDAEKSETVDDPAEADSPFIVGDFLHWFANQTDSASSTSDFSLQTSPTMSSDGDDVDVVADRDDVADDAKRGNAADGHVVVADVETKTVVKQQIEDDGVTKVVDDAADDEQIEDVGVTSKVVDDAADDVADVKLDKDAVDEGGDTRISVVQSEDKTVADFAFPSDAYVFALEVNPWR
jgi:hypothetical protein